MQNILKNGTQGNHLSVNTVCTIGFAQTASPIINGAIIYVLVLIARRVIFFTRLRSSCEFAIAGKRTLSMDVLMLFTITFGNLSP